MTVQLAWPRLCVTCSSLWKGPSKNPKVISSLAVSSKCSRNPGSSVWGLLPIKAFRLHTAEALKSSSVTRAGFNFNLYMSGWLWHPMIGTPLVMKSNASMSSNAVCLRSSSVSLTFFFSITFLTDGSQFSCNLSSSSSNFLAKILAFSSLVFISSKLKVKLFCVICFTALRVSGLMPFESMGCSSLVATWTNSSGVWYWPTQSFPSSVVLSPLIGGKIFWKEVNLVWDGRRSFSLNSGISGPRFRCCRCWAAKVRCLSGGLSSNWKLCSWRNLIKHAATAWHKGCP